MSKHTPGPWTISHDKKHSQQRISANDVPVAVTKEEANARLIAAAPDLLAALQEITDTCAERASFDGDPAMKRWCGAICETARAAIAKAEGIQS